MLELDDIQSGVLRPRPTPYAATASMIEEGQHRLQVFSGILK